MSTVLSSTIGPARVANQSHLRHTAHHGIFAASPMHMPENDSDALLQILNEVCKLSEQDWQYKLEASFIEVYNNTLRDLLAEGAGVRPDAGRILDNNAIKHDSAGGHTVVAGASRMPVPDATAAAELVGRAAKAR